MKHRISAQARCPYYKHEDSGMIYCCGPHEHSTIHIAFDNKQHAYGYKREFCYEDYNKCAICNMLDDVNDE